VSDPQRLDPALLAEGECDEVTELDDLLLREVPTEPLPNGLVGAGRRPDELTGVGQRGLLTLVEALRALELEELVVVPFA
jgi:hypothetical protein